MAITSADRAINLIVADALVVVEVLETRWAKKGSEYGRRTTFLLGRLSAGVETLERLSVLKVGEPRLSGPIPLPIPRL